ncbi:MAG: FKBP-type peptidyl-prolyl cis-trans isomerase [Lachnospiraceae bacterium]|nr:FKBP-type peptidyl-prolyl cis-trans isomerase [Lachnospiraceae bacterium]
MKNEIFAVISAVIAIASLTACSNDAAILTDTNVSKYVKIGEYKNMTVNSTQYELYDEDIQAAMEDLFRSQCEPVALKEGSVANGEWINIDYTGKVAGSEYGGGSEDGRFIKDGAASIVPGFDEQVIGMKPGESKDFDVKLPDDYWSTSNAGKDASFTVKVNYIVPQITDETVKGLNCADYSTTEELKAFVTSELTAQMDDANKSMALSAIKNRIMSGAEFESFPEEMVNYQKEIINSSIADILADFSAELDAETYFQYAYNVPYSEVVDSSLKSRLVILLIAKKEKIKITDEELSSSLASLAAEKGVSEEEVLKNYNNDREFFREFLITKKVNDFLYDNNTVEVLE